MPVTSSSLQLCAQHVPTELGAAPNALHWTYGAGGWAGHGSVYSSQNNIYSDVQACLFPSLSHSQTHSAQNSHSYETFVLQCVCERATVCVIRAPKHWRYQMPVTSSSLHLYAHEPSCE